MINEDCPAFIDFGIVPPNIVDLIIEYRGELSPITKKDLKSERKCLRWVAEDGRIINALSSFFGDKAPKIAAKSEYFGVSPVSRFYRYTNGMFFSAHVDGCFYDSKAFSVYTVLLYLSDCESGHTVIDTDPEIRIKPEKGRCIAFQHRVPHEAEKVTCGGVKDVLRVDLMYKI